MRRARWYADREPARGRFHGALSVRRELIENIGGWLGVMPPGEEKRADFDQRLLATLAQTAAVGDPLHEDPDPSYIYGWGRAQHCSALMANPADLNWYDQHAVPGKMRFID